ncbi:MAG TPA: hypothetical protein VGB13_00685 [Candidatus Krumholzibacteria bacterium]|jgi:hypothetical protein
MRRNENVRTRKFHRSGLWLFAFAALLLPQIMKADTAAAELRVRAEIRTPNVRVRLGHDHGRIVHRQPLLRAKLNVACTQQLSARDREIAHRMADMTRTGQGRLLNLRRSGFSWREIGFDLGLSRRQIRWAMSGTHNDHFAWNQGPRTVHRGR